MKAVKTLLCLAALATGACGGSSDATNTGPAGGSAVPGSVAGAPSGVKVVAHETLLTFLPNLPGWTKGEPQGETDTASSVSRVQVNYDMRGSSLSIEIMDSSMDSDVLAIVREITKPGHSKTSPIGYEKSTTVAGFPANEEWSAEAKNGTVSVLVADRFTVGVTGNSMPDVEAIRKIAEAIDLKKLAALR